MNMLTRQDSFQQLDPLYKIQPNNNNRHTLQDMDDEDTKIDSRSEIYDKPDKNSFAEIFLKNENGNNQNEINNKNSNNSHYLSNSSIEGNASNNNQIQNNNYYLDQTPSNINKQQQIQPQQQQFNQFPEQQLQRNDQSFSQRFQQLPLQQQSSFNMGFNGYQPMKTEFQNQNFNRQEMPQDNYSYVCQDNFQINNQQPMEMNIQRQNSICQQQKHYMNNFNQDIGFQEQNLGLCLNKIDSIQQQFETPQLNFNSSFQQQQQQQQQQLPQQQDLNQYQNNVQSENQFFQQIPQNPQRQSSLFAGQMNEKFQIPQQKIEYNDNNNNIMKMDIGGNLLTENQFQGENFYQYQNQQQQQKQPMDIQRNPVQEYKQAKRTRKQKQKQGGKKRQTDQQKKIVQKVKKNLFRNFSRQFFDYLIDNWSNISNKLKKVLSSKQYTSFTHHLNQQQQKQIVTKQNFHKIFFPYKNKFVRQKAEENTNDSQTNLNKKIMRAIAFQFIKTEFLQTCLTSRISNWPIFYEQRYSIISLLSSNASLY